MNKISLIFAIIIILVDLYAYKGILTTFPRLVAGNWVFPSLHFGITAIFIVMLLILTRLNLYERKPEVFAGFFFYAGVFLMFYLPKLVFIVFHLTEDIYHLLAKATVAVVNLAYSGNHSVTRIHFLSITGLFVSTVPFLAVLYGMTFGRFNYKVENVRLAFTALPESFNGLKIIQISDLHLGSIYNKKEKIVRAINLINSQHPDLILFTGDLVNNFSEEALGWEEIVGQLKAKYGKYSILGNHDYGDYWQWIDAEEKHANMALLIDLHKRMGFRLLLNESTLITNKTDSIVLLGVENWGKPPFKQYGDLQKAQSSVNGASFKILLSHDPSHWEAEVAGKTSIPLTLSGHTHAMQMGIRLNGYSWSPAKYFYKQWNGLYKYSEQYLYVNRGLGYIGFPGRIGMSPEITVIELFTTD